jgi:hypothetical protein
MSVFSLIPIESSAIKPQINRAMSMMTAIPKSMYAMFFMLPEFSVNIQSTIYINNVLDFSLILFKNKNHQQ